MFEKRTETLSPAILLDQWNTDIRTALWPIILVLFIYLVFGLFGNTIVIYIYKCRFREYNEDRYFIPLLAMVDLFACIVCTTGEMIVYFNPVKYTNGGVCKLFHSMGHFASGYSAIILTTIAAHRYQAICRPFKPRFTIKMKRAMLLGTFVLMICLMIPSAVTSGIQTVEHRTFNVTGSRCTTVPVGGSSTFPLAYNLLLLTACVSNLLVVCVLYTLVIKVIFQQARKRRIQVIASVIPSSSACRNDKSPQHQSHSKTCCCEVGSDPMQRAANRMTLMFCAVTSVYVICFTPTLTAMVWIALDKDWLNNKSHSEILGVRLLRNMFIINNIVNPVIYGIFDTKFRDEIMKIIQGRK